MSAGGGGRAMTDSDAASDRPRRSTAMRWRRRHPRQRRRRRESSTPPPSCTQRPHSDLVPTAAPPPGPCPALSLLAERAHAGGTASPRPSHASPTTPLRQCGACPLSASLRGDGATRPRWSACPVGAVGPRQPCTERAASASGPPSPVLTPPSTSLSAARTAKPGRTACGTTIAGAGRRGDQNRRAAGHLDRLAQDQSEDPPS